METRARRDYAISDLGQAKPMVLMTHVLERNWYACRPTFNEARRCGIRAIVGHDDFELLVRLTRKRAQHSGSRASSRL
jgi:hypothetical protein